MSTNNPLTLVIFGATGNLYADKLAKSLFLLFEEGNTLPSDFKIIAFARKDFSNQDFRTYTKDSILKRSETYKIDASKLDDFLTHIEYWQGDFSGVNDFVKLKNYLSLEKDRSILLHLATTSLLYEKIFKNIKAAGLNTVNERMSILIEKPFGKDGADTKHLHAILSNIFADSEVFHVDHYLAKETTRVIPLFRFKDGSLEEKWNNKNIEKIKVIFHESNIVGSRGASYDTVGAFRDVGENHMLELLALTIMDKPLELHGEAVRKSRAKALQDLYIDQSCPMTKGQYEGYLSEPGVRADSKTETFFRVFLKSKNPRFADVEFELEGGKGLIDMHSNITTTTVTVEVYFKNAKNSSRKEFKIQPVPGTSYDSYIKVYTDAIALDQTLFVSMEEIISEWKLADELLTQWKNIPLVIYKKGSKAEEVF
ncbi:MAG TPA: hypothetical protein VGO21_04255 [Candidatus Paceibacterota bacterium]|jgi:glucose-6-phosphate 1-dehydrogenase|nr:hypothetical protein [Candidatus Paceibacterota bacterium]